MQDKKAPEAAKPTEHAGDAKLQGSSESPSTPAAKSPQKTPTSKSTPEAKAENVLLKHYISDTSENVLHVTSNFITVVSYVISIEFIGYLLNVSNVGKEKYPFTGMSAHDFFADLDLVLVGIALSLSVLRYVAIGIVRIWKAVLKESRK